jgi:hypothetical protein
MDSDKYFLMHRIAAGRRRYKRVETRQGAASVYWGCEKLEDTARVRDLSLGGCLSRHRKCWLWERRSGLTFLSKKARSGPPVLCGTQSLDAEWD